MRRVHSLLVLAAVVSSCGSGDADPPAAAANDPEPPAADPELTQAPPRAETEAEPEPEPEPEPPHRFPIATRDNAGAESCEVDEPTVISVAGAGVARVAHDGRAGLLVYPADDAHLSIHTIDATGTVAAEPRSLEMSEATGLVRVAPIGERFLILTAHRQTFHAALVDRAGALLGEPIARDGLGLSSAAGASAPGRYWLIAGAGSNRSGVHSRLYEIATGSDVLAVEERELEHVRGGHVTVSWSDGIDWALGHQGNGSVVHRSGWSAPVAIEAALDAVALDGEDVISFRPAWLGEGPSWVYRCPEEGPCTRSDPIGTRATLPPPYDQLVYARVGRRRFSRHEVRSARPGSPGFAIGEAVDLPEAAVSDTAGDVALIGSVFLVAWPTRSDLRVMRARCAGG